MLAEWVSVSEDMFARIGRPKLAPAILPVDPILIGFSLGKTPWLHVTADIDGDGEIAVVIARAACSHFFDCEIVEGDYHLNHELRGIALAIRDCELDYPARSIYRLGKAIELLCETFRLFGDDELVRMQDTGVISLADGRRLIEARRLIDERWQEKLTIDGIARACGLNRVKLTQGFRAMFRSTVANAIAQRRLDAASHLLRTTDRAVSTIGYESGYLNNASFARAFARRFGVSPSEYRAAKLAA